MTIFEEFNFLSEAELPEIIAKADISSFAIVDPTRPFYPEIARYSPIEIFELVDPPTFPLNAIICIVRTDNINRWANVANYIKRNTNEPARNLSENQDFRYEQIRGLKIARGPIFIVWSPIYRYTEDENEDVDPEFDRPDLDNIPGVTVYVWGF